MIKGDFNDIRSTGFVPQLRASYCSASEEIGFNRLAVKIRIAKRRCYAYVLSALVQRNFVGRTLWVLHESKKVKLYLGTAVCGIKKID